MSPWTEYINKWINQLWIVKLHCCCLLACVYIRACVRACVWWQRLPNLRSSGFRIEKSVVKIPFHRSAMTSRLIFRYFLQTLHTNGGIDHFLVQHSDCLFNSNDPFGLCIVAASDSPTVPVTMHVFCLSLWGSSAVQTAALCHVRTLMAQTLTVLWGCIC